jgi:hypothetical protein
VTSPAKTPLNVGLAIPVRSGVPVPERRKSDGHGKSKKWSDVSRFADASKRTTVPVGPAEDFDEHPGLTATMAGKTSEANKAGRTAGDAMTRMCGPVA